MIQINNLYSLENIKYIYYINENLEIINIVTNKVKKWTLGKRGYYYVSLIDIYNKTKKVSVHKIIALAFVKNAPYKVINHKDGNKLNNEIHNLEFSTIKDNTLHAFKLGLIPIKESLFLIVFENNENYVGTIKEISCKYKIPKGTLYDIFYKKKGSKKYNIYKLIISESKY